MPVPGSFTAPFSGGSAGNPSGGGFESARLLSRGCGVVNLQQSSELVLGNAGLLVPVWGVHFVTRVVLTVKDALRHAGRAERRRDANIVGHIWSLLAFSLTIPILTSAESRTCVAQRMGSISFLANDGRSLTAISGPLLALSLLAGLWILSLATFLYLPYREEVACYQCRKRTSTWVLPKTMCFAVNNLGLLSLLIYQLLSKWGVQW